MASAAVREAVMETPAPAWSLGYQSPARQRGVNSTRRRTPSFFGYLGYSCAILLPVFLLITLVFFGRVGERSRAEDDDRSGTDRGSYVQVDLATKMIF
jgi:hypothetical protein